MQERLLPATSKWPTTTTHGVPPWAWHGARVRAERPDYVLYAQDCFHPGPLGSYLAANVIFTTIYGKPYQTDWHAGFPGRTGRIHSACGSADRAGKPHAADIKKVIDLYGSMPRFRKRGFFWILGRHRPSAGRSADRMPALTARSAPASASSFRRSTRSAPLCAVTAP